MNNLVVPIPATSFDLPIIGDRDFTATSIKSLKEADIDSVVFYSGKDVEFLSTIPAGIVIANLDLKEQLDSHKAKAVVFSEKPKLTFLRMLEEYCVDSFENTVDDVGKVSSKAIIEPNVVLGKDCEIYPQSVLCGKTVIGSKCRVLSGTIIGVTGLGDLWDGEKFHRFTHIGGVLLGDNVSVGSNVSILKGMLENTIIGDGTRIGNNVNIGHSVQIGKNCYISSGVTIGGACVIEDNTWLAVGCTLKDHVVVGKNTMIGTGAVLMKDALPNSLYLGNPARKVGERNDH